MNLHRKNIIINSLTSGRTKIFVDKTYIVDTPTIDVLQEAEYIYGEVHRENRFDEWLSNDAALLHLVKRKICTLQEDEDIKTLDKAIDDKKVSLYLSYYQNKDFTKKLRKELTILKRNKQRKTYRRHYLDDYTLDGFAERIKNYYIFYSITLDGHGNRLAHTFDKVSLTLLERVVQEYWKASPTDDEYKEIARTEPWQALWSINKLANFESLGNSQRNLVLYTQMYENAYKHPDSPDDKIINDNDLFEGWMIYVRRKQENENKQKGKEHVDAKHPDSSEIYIPVKTTDEAIEVDSLNDASGRILKGRRVQLIKAQGTVQDKDIIKLDQQGQGK